MQTAPAPRHTSFGALFDALLGNVERVHPGQARDDPARARVPLRRGPPPHRGRPRRREDVDGQGDRPLDRRQLAPHPVHARPAPVRRHGRVGVEPRRRTSSSSGPVGSSPTSSSPTRSTGPRRRRSRRCSRRWRSSQVTVDAHTYRLDRPFMVIATQNPIELEGTYPLPEAQLDRFLMRIRMGYPSRESEVAILDTHGSHATVEDIRPVASGSRHRVGGAGGRVRCTSPTTSRRTSSTSSTRPVDHRDLSLGVSPRGALALQRAARASPPASDATTSSPTT